MLVKELFNLTGKTAVITGGSVGLGAQMAEALAEMGANLAVAARKRERCEALCAELEKEYGIKALPIGCDVSKPGDCANLVDSTIEQFGKIDILVNNAGTTWGADSLDYPMDKWAKVIDLNLTGLFALSAMVARKMKGQGGGKIINIASTAGFAGVVPEIQDTVAYNASKGAVLTLTKDLAIKWARYGIYVNAIAPGYFLTNMTKGTLAEHNDMILPGIPLNRYGGRHDLKGAIVYLSSAASDYMTGQCLIIDGGSMAGF